MDFIWFTILNKFFCFDVTQLVLNVLSYLELSCKISLFPSPGKSKRKSDHCSLSLAMFPSFPPFLCLVYSHGTWNKCQEKKLVVSSRRRSTCALRGNDRALLGHRRFGALCKNKTDGNWDKSFAQEMGKTKAVIDWGTQGLWIGHHLWALVLNSRHCDLSLSDIHYTVAF